MQNYYDLRSHSTNYMKSNLANEMRTFSVPYNTTRRYPARLLPWLNHFSAMVSQFSMACLWPSRACGRRSLEQKQIGTASCRERVQSALGPHAWHRLKERARLVRAPG